MTEHGAAIRYTADEDARTKRGPAADGTLGEPHRSEQRCVWWKDASAVGALATYLGNDRHDAGSGAECTPTAEAHGGDCRGEHGELQRETRWTRDLVVRLSHALREKVARLGGMSRDEEIEWNSLASARSDDRSHELEVLEHRAAVVAAGALEDGPPNAECAGPVAADDAIEECTTRVPAGVPGERREVVLWSHDVGIGKRVHDAEQGVRVVAHVVVGDDEPLVRRKAHSGEYAANLAHRRRKIGCRSDVPNDAAPCGGVGGEHVGRGSVDDDDLGARRQPVEIVGELALGARRLGAQGKDVGAAHAVGSLHGLERGNCRAPREDVAYVG